MRVRELLTSREHRFARRLVLMLLWLIAIDRLVPIALRVTEHQRYEGRAAFRFADNDLFGLRPLVRYLREHPRGERRRIVFMGNSMMYGYGVTDAETLPAQFERQAGDVRVFNASTNGAETGTSYLVAKAIIDSVDGMFVQSAGTKANPMLGSLIPVDEADARAFQVDTPHPIERYMDAALSRVWRLYDARERLQAAVFGMSTRQYLYLHKKDIALWLLGRRASRAPAADAAGQDARQRRAGRPLSLRAPRAPRAGRREDLRQPRMLLDFAELAKARDKRVVFVQFEYGNDAATAAFNAHYAPHAEIVIVDIPRELKHDHMHLTAAGCAGVAAALLDRERQRERQRAAR